MSNTYFKITQEHLPMLQKLGREYPNSRWATIPDLGWQFLQATLNLGICWYGMHDSTTDFIKDKNNFYEAVRAPWEWGIGVHEECNLDVVENDPEVQFKKQSFFMKDLQVVLTHFWPTLTLLEGEQIKPHIQFEHQHLLREHHFHGEDSTWTMRTRTGCARSVFRILKYTQKLTPEALNSASPPINWKEVVAPEKVLESAIMTKQWDKAQRLWDEYSAKIKDPTTKSILVKAALDDNNLTWLKKTFPLLSAQEWEQTLAFGMNVSNQENCAWMLSQMGGFEEQMHILQQQSKTRQSTLLWKQLQAQAVQEKLRKETEEVNTKPTPAKNRL